MNQLNVITSGASTQDFKKLDVVIDAETQRKLKVVPEAVSFNVWTACIIDDEFVLSSEYELPSDLYVKIKNA